VLAVEKPSVRLVEVRRVPDVRRQDRIVPPDTVDLKRQLDGSLHLPRESHRRGPAEALSVHDEAGRPRLPREDEGQVAASILEGFRMEPPAPQVERELPDAFGVVVPCVAAAQEPHRQTRARG
jgi:hypothetical protein